MLNALANVIRRDLILYGYRRGEWFMPLVFFVMIISLFPIALGSQNALLVKMAPCIIWIAVLLSLLMSLTAIFQADYEEGILEQYLVSAYPLSWLILGKAVAHGFMMGLPLWMLAVLSGFCLNLNDSGLWSLALTLAIGIPTLSVLGSLMAALTLGLTQGGILLAVLALPLMIPILIFGTSAVQAAIQGVSFHSEILLLAALFVFVWVLGPVAISAALKTSVE